MSIMETKKASEFGDGIRSEISALFVEGFGHWLTYFSKDMAKLERAFAHMFLLDSFYVARIDGEVAGITACTDGHKSSIRLNSRELRKHLGWIVGGIAYSVLRKELENHPYPFSVEKGTGSVEFVSTASKHRGKGVAAEIIRYIFSDTPYENYILEVGDTNASAVRLYEKVGFGEFHRVAHKHAKRSGYNYLVYMRCRPDKSAK